MISLVDFVKAFNSNLEYRILIVVDENAMYLVEIKKNLLNEYKIHIASKIIMYNMSI